MTFSTLAIGKKIANLRKEKNLTQMELADAMGVSYQAVSNWERGNSMPDISKLPELADLLGCSIDALLTDGAGSQLIKHVVEGDAETYIRENKVSAQIIGDVAPVLKPKQTERLLDCILRENEEYLTIEDLTSIAPFVGEAYLDRFVQRVSITGDIECLCGLAPFLSEETLDSLVMRAMERGDISGCAGLYPFLSRDTLHKLADALVKKSGFAAISGLAPFLS